MLIRTIMPQRPWWRSTHIPSTHIIYRHHILWSPTPTNASCEFVNVKAMIINGIISEEWWFHIAPWSTSYLMYDEWVYAHWIEWWTIGPRFETLANHSLVDWAVHEKAYLPGRGGLLTARDMLLGDWTTVFIGQIRVSGSKADFGR
jgi:hypothetical protein